MSTVTDVILTAQCGEDFDRDPVGPLNEWLLANGHPLMLQVDNLLGGERRGYAMQLCLWINACNYLEHDDFLRAVRECPWEDPDTVQVFFNYEEGDRVEEIVWRTTTTS